MFFASDNWAGAHPQISQSLNNNSSGFAPAYGASALDKKVEAKFNDIFERDVAVYFVGTGTAANSLALASVNRPGGVSFCHREAHAIEDECGAPEYFTGGARLHPVDGALGRINPENLTRELKRFPPDFIHAGQPMAVTLTQATEIGTIYSRDEIRAISKVCREFGVPLHMDGARFANALVALDVSPAQMTHELGVDVVSFGGTKNGCWCAEALVFLNPEQARDLPFIRKRAAQLFSKTRFVAAQFDAYFEDGLWLELARHANDMTAQLAKHIENAPDMHLAWQPATNEAFALMSQDTLNKLHAQGVHCYAWNMPHSFEHYFDADLILVRFVTSYATQQSSIDQFGALVCS